VSGTTHTNAGTYSDSWSFTGGANYNDIASTAITDTIDKAASVTVVTINGGPFPYTGLAQTPATVAVTGAGGLSLTPAASYANNVSVGTATATYTYAGDANHTGSADNKTFTIDRIHLTAVGSPFGAEPRVTVLNADGTVRFNLVAYDSAFRGGVNVATGDVTGDGVDDIITGAGVGGAPHVKVFDGMTGAEVASFYAYSFAFRGGVSVGAADLGADGVADIVAGAGAGGAPHVKAFRFAGLVETASFFAFDPVFRGGVNVATGDVTGDGRPDLVLGAGLGGGAVVRVFDGATGFEVSAFFVGPQDDRGGARVAVADLDGDGTGELVVRVLGVNRVFDPLTGADRTADFSADDLSGVFVG